MKPLKLSFPLTHILLILALGILVYANTFGAPFVLDDLTSIVRNPTIKDIANFIPGGPGYDSNPRRWLGYLTFALNYHYSGLDVFGYHLFNLLVHLASALLLYALLCLTFHTPHMKSSRLFQHANLIALLAALFFVVHPVQIQAVTYIVQRLTSLATMFYLLAFASYIAARIHLSGECIGKQNARWKPILLLACAVLASLLAMKTKEIAFTLPIGILLYEACFFHGEWKRRMLFLLPLLLTLPVIPFSVIATGGGDYLGSDAASLDDQFRAGTELPRLHYLFTQFRVIVTYFRLLIFPARQNLDYDYPVFPTFFAMPVVLSFLLICGLIAMAVYLHYRSGREVSSSFLKSPLARDPVLRLVSFGLFWFFLALSVESSLIPIEDVIFEHRLYLPSVGIAMAVAVLVVMASLGTANFFSGRIPLIAAAMVILTFSAATWQRNTVWKSNITLWEDVVRKSPEKGRPWYNLGTHLAEGGRGRMNESIRALTTAAKLDPLHADTWHNLGRAYLLEGDIQAAIPALRNAVRLDPYLDNAVVNLSVALIQNYNPTEAVVLLERILPRIADFPEARINLGIAYAHAGNLNAARRELTILYRLAPQLAPNLEKQISRMEAGIPLR